MLDATKKDTSSRAKERPQQVDQRGTMEVVKDHILSFPGGPLVKNPPHNSRDTDSIFDPGRSHMPQDN